MNNAGYYIGFSHCLGIGPARFDVLLKEFKDVETSYNAPHKKIQQLLGVKVASNFRNFKKEFHQEEMLSVFKKKQISVVTREDKKFPSPLLHIPDAPICLYVKGDIKSYDFGREKFFAIVGTRKATSYGQQITYRFAFELASHGFTIVSGLALGVDAIAHTGALDAASRTIAFLGCGVDIVYPPANKPLYDRILDEGGLVISEFPPGATVLKGLFVARNRLISGLSRGVLVTEGGRDSGALITARYAAEQGRDVFAPPVPLTSTMSHAPNILLKEGAKLITSVSDVLEEYEDIQTKHIKKTASFADMTKEEKLIFQVLSEEPCFADDIAPKVKKGVDSMLQTLTLMEIKGIIEKNSEGRFQVKT